MPVMPIVSSAARTSSHLWGLMTAVTSFMQGPSLRARACSRNSEVKRATSVPEVGPGPAGRVQVVGRLRVQDEVDTERLVVRVDAEAERLVEDPDQRRRDDTGEEERRERRDRLLAELVEAAAVEEALHTVDAGSGEHVGIGEETDQERADEAADEVDADDVERVVVPEVVLPADRDGADRTGDDADQGRAQRRDRAAGRRDRDETRDDTGRRAERRGVAVAHLLDERPGEQARAAGHEGVDEDDRRGVVGGERR